MAQLKFYRKSTAPTSPVTGAIWFNTSDKTIQIYTGTAWEKYAGNLNNATWANNTLTITKHDGSSIALDFSDMASAAVMGKMLTAVGLNTDGTFKKNATNYGGSATSIGGEISAIDTKLKSVSDLVGTTSVATQISDAKTELIGNIADGANGNTIGGAKAFANAAASAAEGHANEYTDDALEALAGTVSSTAGEKVVVSVKQTNGKVDDVTVTLDDIASASELADVKKTAEAAQTAGEVSTAISTEINKLNADKSGESTDKHVKVQVVESSGKLTGVTVTTADIASAATLKTVKDQVDAFFAGADISETANKYKDTLKELQTYITEDAAAATTMTKNIAANKADVRTLATSTVNGHAIGSVVEDEVVAQTIVLNGSEIKLDGYAMGTNTAIAATDTVNQALGKLEAMATAAAVSGVQNINGHTGNVGISTGTANGTISVGGDDVAVKGLGGAAYKAENYYATKSAVDEIVNNTLPLKLEKTDITTGASNGTIKVKGTEVYVAGLKSAAYTEASAYATAAQGAKADTAYQKPALGIGLSDLSDVVTASLAKANAAAPQATTYTKAEVDAMFTWAEF